MKRGGTNEQTMTNLSQDLVSLDGQRTTINQLFVSTLRARSSNWKTKGENTKNSFPSDPLGKLGFTSQQF